MTEKSWGPEEVAKKLDLSQQELKKIDAALGWAGGGLGRLQGKMDQTRIMLDQGFLGGKYGSDSIELDEAWTFLKRYCRQWKRLGSRASSVIQGILEEI